VSRFVVIEGSQSGHCCFDYTVVDTDRPDLAFATVLPQPRWVALCETFYRKQADAIAAAMNAETEKQ
jgi:hypothetical protein